MTTISTDEVILARVKPILRNKGKPMGVTELGRLVAIDSSAIYRALMKCPDVSHTNTHSATMFALVERK